MLCAGYVNGVQMDDSLPQVGHARARHQVAPLDVDPHHDVIPARVRVHRRAESTTISSWTTQKKNPTKCRPDKKKKTKQNTEADDTRTRETASEVRDTTPYGARGPVRGGVVDEDVYAAETRDGRRNRGCTCVSSVMSVLMASASPPTATHQGHQSIIQPPAQT